MSTTHSATLMACTALEPEEVRLLLDHHLLVLPKASQALAYDVLADISLQHDADVDLDLATLYLGWALLGNDAEDLVEAGEDQLNLALKVSLGLDHWRQQALDSLAQHQLQHPEDAGLWAFIDQLYQLVATRPFAYMCLPHWG